MATPQEKLAAALGALRELQWRGIVAIRARDLSRDHRERLMAAGFLRRVINGWFIVTRPDAAPGESTAWHASFWDFCAAYLRSRFAEDWCLSPEQSLSLHAGNRAVPAQLPVRAPGARNRATGLLFGTSVFDVRAGLPDAGDVEDREGMRLFSLPAALVACAPGFFRSHETDARGALAQIRDASEVLPRLLGGGRTTIAGRLAGAFRNIGRGKIADDILRAMRSAGYAVREVDPFAGRIALDLPRREAPVAARVRLMWRRMREEIPRYFPEPPSLPDDAQAYLRQVDDIYVTDAYHSLSIEGYRVDAALIERARGADWNPDRDERDRAHRDALAARGYWHAFLSVRTSLGRILSGTNPGAVADEDHGEWYRQLFAPSVAAGLLRREELTGYRSGPVHIRNSMHVPPRGEAVLDAMPVLFEMLEAEREPAVRAVLGHLVFVYIHPYGDGNGRIGRFLMNLMLASGGYSWTIVPVERRAAYMAAIETACVRQDIAPFAEFLGVLVREDIDDRRMVGIP